MKEQTAVLNQQQIKLIIEQEFELHQVWFSSNKSVVERLLHPSFKEVAESGRSHDFKELLSYMDEARDSQDSVHSQEYECIKLDEHSVLLLYKSAILKATGEYVSFAKRSSIWIDTGILWQMKYHQGTTCEAFEVIESM